MADRDTFEKSFDRFANYYNDKPDKLASFSTLSNIKTTLDNKDLKLTDSINDSIKYFEEILHEYIDENNFTKKEHLRLVIQKDRMMKYLGEYMRKGGHFFPDTLISDYLRKTINSLKKNFSNDVIEDLHGVINSIHEITHESIHIYNIKSPLESILDYIIKNEFPEEKIKDYKALDETEKQELFGIAKELHDESLKNLKRILPKLLPIIHDILKNETLDSKISENGYVESGFYSMVARKYNHKYKKEPINKFTLRNWLQDDDKRQIITEKLEKLTSAENSLPKQ